MYSRNLTLRAVAAARQTAICHRGFAFSATKRLGLKESSTRTHEETNVDYDLHKKDSLAKQKKGSGHWKPELASDSEEAVKADRASRDSHSSEQIAALQERTKKSAEETSKAGTSMRDAM
ncbi:hypothetical protein TRIATDRAFT_41061 [Trichoderma atroviride IMI 206040]|uniref:Mitochondrial carrier protein PET8 n=1 Tax=Hypocrea atroviridis (strain ATCC 20476 / IMI 206040) TaxID=452589 RepID=G9NU65_HYPAI|nr:uncharacterized protein TRIATDRAFT_41061 [Trichoderma atroviride IMI 206040]EHK45598.1 hypothetical protein TRIATDRAFT_41061 [Trichoderma atroviride IMI 206040]